MSIPTNQLNKVEEAVSKAVLVAFDGSHKMYVAMDQQTADWFQTWYPETVSSTAGDMLEALQYWWDQSDELRFIQSLWSVNTPEEDYEYIIEQGSEEDPF